MSNVKRAPASTPATWHLKDPSTWNFAQRSIVLLDIIQDPAGSARPPVHAKEDKVPVYPVWRQHAFVLPRALPPLLIHWALMRYAGITLHPAAAVVFYAASFLTFGVSLFKMLRRMGKHYGFVGIFLVFMLWSSKAKWRGPVVRRYIRKRRRARHPRLEGRPVAAGRHYGAAHLCGLCCL